MHGDFLKVLFTVLLVMDPIGIIPQFLSVTSRYDNETRKAIVLKAVLIAGMVLLIFLLSGKFLLGFFGIKPGAFYISGGILFFVIAFEMLYSRHRTSRSVHGEKSGDADDHTGISVAIFPLAIPFIAGPGLLTVIIMFANRGESWLYSTAMLLPAILIGLVITFVVLRSSSLLLKFFGSMGIMVMEKIMGLILAGFAVEFVYDGLVSLGIL